MNPPSNKHCPGISTAFRSKNVNKRHPRISAASFQQQGGAFLSLTWLLMLNAISVDIVIAVIVIYLNVKRDIDL